MYGRRGKSILGLVLQSYLNSKLCEPKQEQEAKVDNIWFDELLEVSPEQPKKKALWKREINPRKH